MTWSSLQETAETLQEKAAALGDDWGRDVNSVHKLLRKHEAFENELHAMDAQLKVRCMTFIAPSPFDENVSLR